MGATFESIPVCQKGGDSLINHEYANKLIVPLNAVLGGQIAPIAGVGSIKYSGGVFIIDLTQLDARLRSLENASATSNTAIYTQINNLTNTVNNLYTSFNTLSDTVTVIQGDVTQIINSLNEATINATCDNAGGIDISLTIPNLPS